MAIMKGNRFTGMFRGKIGDLVVRQVHDKVVVSQAPDRSHVKPTENQLKRRKIFAEAQLYAKSIIDDPLKKQAVEKTLSRGQRAYNTLIAEYLAGKTRSF
jgi:hypothetical protein